MPRRWTFPYQSTPVEIRRDQGVEPDEEVEVSNLVPFVEIREVLREAVERTVNDLVTRRDLPSPAGKPDGVNVDLSEPVTHAFGTSKRGITVEIKVFKVGAEVDDTTIWLADGRKAP